MSTLEAELNDLKTEKKRLEEDIATANTTLQQTQAKLTDANNKIAARQKAATEIGATKDAGKALREKLKKDLADAQTSFDELQKRLDTEIPAERRAGIAAAVAKIDAAIDEARKVAANQQQKTLEAENAAADAKKKATDAEAASQQAAAELRQWSKKVETARGQVTKLVADTKAALEAGRFNEAYLKLLELKQALAALPMMSSQENENKIATAFTEKGKQAEAAAADATKAADALTKQKAAQAAAEADLRKKEQAREDELKKASAAPPVAPAAPPPPPPPGETPAPPAPGYQQP